MARNTLLTIAGGIGAFAIGYTIGALSTAAGTPRRRVTTTLDGDEVRRIVRDETETMEDERWQKKFTDPHNIRVGDLGANEWESFMEGGE